MIGEKISVFSLDENSYKIQYFIIIMTKDKNMGIQKKIKKRFGTEMLFAEHSGTENADS
ncbi:MAG: hypothetical protein F6K18_04295 [Okeania sp. SIO2C2]|uniref:hypothetical protein n=1 Tax=Okeania TaxID=1458928 RepID=UPI00137502A1|nr:MULTISPECIES: hypothetical protein [Okeania]NEP07228.1 hypothetical protein [Okeania sp. SIO4D6]NEP86099.1 hypothetical protein [Okeania sp. SIO2C2]NEP74373.1 hypothetical protein [Okeania sp. SIO2G5]NEP95432.1 hypothetical protein [Okeania sp. SIO2F5]NEQ93142.1 hypothetical protein [Okeania sp. SIO2G4]